MSEEKKEKKKLIELCEIVERGLEPDDDSEPTSYYEFTVNPTKGQFVVTYCGCITKDLIKLIDAIEIASIEMTTPELKVTIHLSSGGGNTKYSIMFVKYMKGLQKSGRAKFTVIASTNCCSAATYILCAADCSFIYSHTQFVIHSNVTILDTAGAKKCIADYNRRYAKMYSARGNYSTKDFLELLNDPTKDYIFTPEAALAAGLINLIL